MNTFIQLSVLPPQPELQLEKTYTRVSEISYSDQINMEGAFLCVKIEGKMSIKF